MKNATEKLKEYRINWIKNNVRGNKILDIGPIGNNGSFFAHNALREANKNSELHAIDLMMNDRFAKTSQTISVKGDVYQMPYQDQTFDTIFMGEIIEHLENPYKAIKEASRILTKKGVLYLSTPNILRFQNIKRAILGRKFYIKTVKNPIGWHHYEFSFTELDAMLKNAGLEVFEDETMPIKIGKWVIFSKLPLLKNLGNYWFIKAIKK